MNWQAFEKIVDCDRTSVVDGDKNYGEAYFGNSRQSAPSRQPNAMVVFFGARKSFFENDS
jgi:hypothetical protein